MSEFQTPPAAPALAPAPVAAAPVPAPTLPAPVAAAPVAAPAAATPVEAATTGPVQVDRATFVAARLRETLTELANLRTHNADLLTDLAALRKENAAYRAGAAQAEIDILDADYDVGKGTVLQRRQDGTYWRIPQGSI